MPAVDGVVVLAGEDKIPTFIKGTENIRETLMEKLEGGGETFIFLFEDDRMYTRRESELIQQHVTRLRALPGGRDDEVDDLF